MQSTKELEQSQNEPVKENFDNSLKQVKSPDDDECCTVIDDLTAKLQKQTLSEQNIDGGKTTTSIANTALDALNVTACNNGLSREEINQSMNEEERLSLLNGKTDSSTVAINMNQRNLCSSTAEVRPLTSAMPDPNNELCQQGPDASKSSNANDSDSESTLMRDKDSVALILTATSSTVSSTNSTSIRSYGHASLMSTNTTTSYGLNNLQNVSNSSPPPHSYRHSRAYRHFKNPPQPHMCIRTTTDGGEEIFINVLSWTRIVIPQEPLDPIPLYGGMRVPPGSPRNPSIVFAVMANPEVLKDSGRHSKDPEERRAIVELMCDFVEAMNPGVKLVRNAVILKDRDISGELKDVWNAVQAQRDREREEQLLQQRHQQYHYHNMTGNAAATNGGMNVTSVANNNLTTQQIFPRSTLINDVNSGNGTPHVSRKLFDELMPNPAQETEQTEPAINLLAEKLQNSVIRSSKLETENSKVATSINNSNNNSLLGERENSHSQIHNAAYKDQQCSIPLMKRIVGGVHDQHLFKNGILQINGKNTTPKGEKNSKDIPNCALSKNKNTVFENETVPEISKILNNSVHELSVKTTSAAAVVAAANFIVNKGGSATCNGTNAANSANVIDSSVVSGATATTTTTPATITTTTPPVTKREKLSGFLTNGCMFPRFKNSKNKNKDKDSEKEKDKETKPKEKEKCLLLNALKPKSKEKKSNQNHQANEKTQKQQQNDHSSIFGRKGLPSSTAADYAVKKKFDIQVNLTTENSNGGGSNKTSNATANNNNNNGNSSSANNISNADGGSGNSATGASSSVVTVFTS